MSFPPGAGYISTCACKGYETGGPATPMEKPHGGFVSLMQVLATRTAELHRAFAMRTGDPAYDTPVLSDPDEIVITGVNTHACIRTTAIDAYQRDLKVVLASDCMGSYDQEHGSISMRYMDGKIGRAMTNSAIKTHLLSGA